MHLKNFSLLHDNECWHFSPAYDLLKVVLANPADKEELALTLEGKKKKLHKANFEHLGSVLRLSSRQIAGSFQRFHSNQPKTY